jgi:peptidoglycan/LPS O-acetylase OafA/YrhL
MGFVRIFLALSVVLWHIPNSKEHLLNAAVAVVCFFMISGFYMAMVINEKYARDDGPWIGTFYAARFWRLYPTYFAVLLIMVGWFVLTRSPTPFTGRLPMAPLDQLSLIIINLAVIGQDLYQTVVEAISQNSGPSFLWQINHYLAPSYFSQSSTIMVGQAWSLSSEFLFYLMAPFIVRSRLRVAIGLAISLGLRITLIEGFGWRSGIWGYWFFPGALCMFLLGAAAWHVRRALPKSPHYGRIGWVCLAALVFFAARNLVKGGIMLPSNDAGSIDGVEFWLFYVAFALAIPLIFDATRTIKRDRALGELSYPLYLIHGLVCGLIFYKWHAPQGTTADMVAAVVLSCICAWGLYTAVEAPSELYRRGLIQKLQKRNL